MNKHMKNYVHLLHTRRSRYDLTNANSINNEELAEFIGEILKTLPTP
jgi:predicted oxidoreductase (fatty acid repression mutant protein)